MVGGGLGGLSAAALLARAGQTVLVVERQAGPGGCAHALRRRDYTFDPAIHFMPEAGPGRFVDLLLGHLDVRDRCEFVHTGSRLWRAYLPGLTFDAPRGQDEHVAALGELFPHEAEGVRRYMELVARFFHESTHLSMQLSMRDLGRAVERFPTFFKYRNATLGHLLDEQLRDERLKSLCGVIWPYVGLPPSRAALHFVVPLVQTLIEQGAHYCRGGFQRVADALAAAIERDGGELLLRTEVERIVVEDGHATAVRLADGAEVRGGTVISNVDGRQTFERLVGSEHLPPTFLRRLKRLEPSLSAFVVYAATKLDVRGLGLADENLVCSTWDHELAYRRALAGRPGGVWVSVPTLSDPAQAPAGEHLLVITSMASYEVEDGWGERKERFQRELIELVEDAALPGLSESLSFVEAAAPTAIERATLSHRGAAYGWAVTPKQTGSKRLSHDTPIGDLWLSGQWSQEGPGSFKALLSGFQTARSIMGRAGALDAVPDLRPDEMPALVGRAGPAPGDRTGRWLTA